MAVVKPPDIADMNAKCKIETRGTTLDAFGHQQASWSDFISEIWCAIDDMMVPMIAQAFNAILPTQRYMIKFRYRPGLQKDMRITELSTGRVFQIDDINNLDHKYEWYACRCTEISDD